MSGVCPRIVCVRLESCLSSPSSKAAQNSCLRCLSNPKNLTYVNNTAFEVDGSVLLFCLCVCVSVIPFFALFLCFFYLILLCQ